MKNEKGFTIIELLVVVAIIGVIAAIAIPGLRSAREHADQASAVQSMRTLTTAEYLFYPKANVYGDLNALGADTAIDAVLAAGIKANYRFAIQTADSGKAFTITATPVGDAARLPHYFVDQTTVIRVNVGAPADASSTPIPE